MNKIDKKIVGFKVVQPSEALTANNTDIETIAQAIETDAGEALPDLRQSLLEMQSYLVKKELIRPLVCNSKTYRLKPPQAEHALYVTISSIEQEGKRYPFELFFNTKNPNHIEWTSALTLTISIAFRTAIETRSSLSGLISNLKETFGTGGSYLSKVPAKPKFVNGLVAEIGLVIEEFNNECLVWNAHSENHDVWETEVETAERLFEEAYGFTPSEPTKSKITNPCPECGEQLSLLDGCSTCVQGCGYSKCG